MNDNILASVKTMCNVLEDDHSFDNDLILLTNSVLMEIMQEWHGMNHAFRLEDGTETWDDLLGENTTDYEGVKTLIGLKVRLLFDTPSSQTVHQAIVDEIKNLEWRLYFWKDLERIDEVKS